MKKLKIVLLSTALALGLGQAAHAVYTQDQLQSLRGMVENNDTNGILSYLEANPELLDGNDALALALRDFVAMRGSVLGRVFGPSVPNLDRVPDLPDGVESSVQLAGGSLSDFGS